MRSSPSVANSAALSSRPGTAGEVEHLERATREIRRLRTELADVRSRTSTSEEKARRKMATLETAISERDSRIVEVQSMNRSLMEQIEALEKTNKDLMAELTARAKELKDTVKQIEYERSRGDARIAEVENEKNFLQSTWKAKEFELRSDLDRLKLAITTATSLRPVVPAPVQPASPPARPSPRSPSPKRTGVSEWGPRLGALVKDLARMVEDKILRKTLTSLAKAVAVGDAEDVENFRIELDEFYEMQKKLRRSRLGVSGLHEEDEEVFPRKVEISPSKFSVACQTDRLSSLDELERKNARLTSQLRELRKHLEMATLLPGGRANTPQQSVISDSLPGSPDRSRLRQSTPPASLNASVLHDSGAFAAFPGGPWPRRLQVSAGTETSPELPLTGVRFRTVTAGGGVGGGGRRREIEESEEGSLRIRANLE